VKFNLEAATQALFRKMCPGLSREAIWEALHQSVLLFGRGRVYSNVLVGLGETDEDLEQVMQDLAGIGVIPLLRPLTPAGSLADRPGRPQTGCSGSAASMSGSSGRPGFDPGRALTMCAACTGCDLVPGRDT